MKLKWKSKILNDVGIGNIGWKFSDTGGFQSYDGQFLIMIFLHAYYKSTDIKFD